MPQELTANESFNTFRDPAGSVEIQPDRVLRSVHPAFAPEILEFLETPLADRLSAAVAPARPATSASDSTA